ncbi:hypothetical protein SESBI_32415 [Sesbania bispinosa]|nr:hypothetical protein SESBI_32415 [Sesbania bispinosa]
MEETFMSDNVERVYNMEEKYFSKELESCDEFDCDGNDKPRVKTLVGRHTHERVFGNNNEKVGRVAKVVVNRLKSNSKGKGKGTESNSHPQNLEDVVKTLYGMMLTWGEVMGAKKHFSAAFKNAVITHDQIGGVQPSPGASGFEIATATLRRLQNAAAEGAFEGGTSQSSQNHVSDLLQTLANTTGLTIQHEGMEQSVIGLSQSARTFRGRENEDAEHVEGGQAPEAVARGSQEKRDSGPTGAAT